MDSHRTVNSECAALDRAKGSKWVCDKVRCIYFFYIYIYIHIYIPSPFLHIYIYIYIYAEVSLQSPRPVNPAVLRDNPAAKS